MTEQNWKSDRKTTIVCLDSYHMGVPKGRIYTPWQEADAFESLSQFLIKMETLLDDLQMPQAYTEKRTFAPIADPPDTRHLPFHVRNGSLATFEVQVIFRQYTSWQGIITWLDRQLEQSFRSVLELILLMDSALREQKGSDSA